MRLDYSASSRFGADSRLGSQKELTAKVATLTCGGLAPIRRHGIFAF
jgi:hypothetical protein